MPNWCDTTYKIVGDEKELNELFSILKKMDSRKDPTIENGFGNMWLGELVTELGFNWEKMRCRGYISSYTLEDGILTMSMETAWCEQEGTRQSIEKRFPSLTVYYLDEEPGCENYTSNDVGMQFFPEEYVVDEGCDITYFKDIEELAKYAEKKIGSEERLERDISIISDAMDLYLEENGSEDDLFIIHEVKRFDD